MASDSSNLRKLTRRHFPSRVRAEATWRHRVVAMDFPFRRAMSRILVAKDRCQAALEQSPEHHRSESNVQKDALMAMLKHHCWNQEQIDKLAGSVTEVQWCEKDGLLVATTISKKLANNCGQMQDYVSLWNFFKEDEWNTCLLKLPTEAKFMTFQRIVDLDGVKLNEDSWKRIGMGLLMLARHNDDIRAMSPNQKHSYCEIIKNNSRNPFAATS